MAHEYTLFSHLRTGRTVRAHAHARNVFQKFQNVAMRACTLRSQLVAKVRASPNNGFPHEEQIGGTIYLSGTLAWTCVFLHANRLRYLICMHTDTPPLLSFPWSTWNGGYTHRRNVTESAWDAPISMRKKKRREINVGREVEVAFNYGRRPLLHRYDRIPENFSIRNKFV